MTVKKLSVALDADVADEAARRAEAAGLSLSAWMNRAASEALAVDRGRTAVRAWEAENGELTPAELADADRLLDEMLGKRRGARSS